MTFLFVVLLIYLAYRLFRWLFPWLLLWFLNRSIRRAQGAQQGPRQGARQGASGAGKTNSSRKSKGRGGKPGSVSVLSEPKPGHVSRRAGTYVDFEEEGKK